MSHHFQQGILAPIPRVALHLFFSINDAMQVASALQQLCAIADGNSLVVGVGAQTFVALAKTPLTALVDFPTYHGQDCHIPSTPAALWCWVRADNDSQLFDMSQQIEHLLAPAFVLSSSIHCFSYKDGRDLTGYEDGTENPVDEAAITTAFSEDGGSIVAIQQWQHNFTRFNAMTPIAQDHAIGRRKTDNVELEDAPSSAHVKRTAQEDFSPEAFVLRRSMPWMKNKQSGLMFTAFAASADAFLAQLKRMTGQEDGIVDALFQFTQPMTGCFFWCPPIKKDHIDLHQLIAN